MKVLDKIFLVIDRKVRKYFYCQLVFYFNMIFCEWEVVFVREDNVDIIVGQ